MKKLLIAFTAFALLGGVADAGTQCRDAKGKFAKCPPKTAVASDLDLQTTMNTKKDATGRCHWTTTAGKHKAGQLVKCP